MPFTGGPDQSVPAPAQPGTDTPLPFSHTLAVAGTADDFVTIPVGKVGKTISLVNLGPGSAWILNDATATSATGIEVKPKEGYSDDGLEVTTRWSVIGEAGKTPTIRGVAWAG